VIDHIHDNPAGDLSLDALADVAAASRFHWHRTFHALTGETLAQCVRRLRLHLASVALVRGTDALGVIAPRVGYADAATLSRAFSDAYGMSPQAFRDRGELRPFSLNPPEKGPLMYPVTLRNEPERRLAVMPHAGPYHEINRAFEKLYGTLAARGQVAQTGAMVGIYYDDPNAVQADRLRSHAGAEVPAELALAPPLDVLTMRGGRYAVLTFKGPYAGLPAAYDQLFGRWLPTSGETAADAPSAEIYLNSPMNTAPEDLLTEILLPLA
jgi:AraC family transcriptional regulator